MLLIYDKQYFDKQIKPKLNEGWSINKIFKHYNISEGGVRRAVRCYGGEYYQKIAIKNGERARLATFKFAQQGKRVYDKQQELQKLPKIIELINNGLHVYEISDKLNLCYKSITRIVNKLGTDEQKLLLKTNFTKPRKR